MLRKITADIPARNSANSLITVSYTHLTLPTTNSLITVSAIITGSNMIFKIKRMAFILCSPS